MPYLFLLFIVMPIAEIAVLIQVGGAIGGWTTIGIVILTAVLGTAMLRQQGLATLNRAQSRMQQGEMPAQQMLEGLLLLIGGVLLLTPGFITDFFGFCTLIPWSRQFIARKLTSGTLSGFNVFVGGANFSGSTQAAKEAGNPDSIGGKPGSSYGTGQPSGQPNSPSHKGSEGGKVIDGDYQRLD